MYRYVKRFFDVFLGVIGIIVLSPVFLLLSVLILIQMGRPVFFCQERTTRNEKVFKLYKFRTMRTWDSKNTSELNSDGNRVTALGKVLRSLSLDELPELINIIKGDLSIIGPRPLLPQYHDFYFEEELSRFKVRAGLIPPEVLNGDFLPTWNNQLQYESDYSNNISFFIDLKIFLAVFRSLFLRNNNSYGTYERKPLNCREKQR